MVSRNFLLLFGSVLFIFGVRAQVIDFAASSDPFQTFWPFHPTFNLGFFRPQQPWWKGPNVCIERHDSDKNKTEIKNETRGVQNVDDFDETIANHFQAALTFSSCFETPDRYECTTKTNVHGDEKTHVVKYKCCHGFVRSRQLGMCVQQDELKPILEVLDKMNATSFRNLIKTVGLEDRLSQNNYTIFVPKDEALENATEEISEMNKVDVSKRDSSKAASEVVLSHVVPGIIDINDYSNEDLLHSENNNSTIRLNFYPTPSGGKLVTANCVRISRANIFATKGIVHLVDESIPTAELSIGEIIDRDARFSSFKKSMDSSKLREIFNERKQYTAFLPTNDAFNNLDGRIRQKLLSGNGCAATILKHHITPHTVCSSAVIENATVHDLDGDIINMERRTEDDIFVDGKSKVSESDILATNGVIHVIDSVLVPSSALEIVDVLNKRNLSKFQELVEKAGLRETLDSLQNVTYFVPFDEAFDEPEAAGYIETIQNNPQKLKELVLYHSIKGELETEDMETTDLTSNAEGKKLRLRVYPFFSNLFLKTLSPPPMIQCATLTRSEEKACGAMVHEIDKVLIPPSKTLLDMVRTDSRLSTFASLLKGTEIEQQLKNPNQNLTVLAATNYAFGRYKYDLDALRQNRTLAENVLKRHIIKRAVCCQELNYGDQIFNRWSSFADPFQSGSSQVIKDCDKIATNGILHTVTAFMYRHQ